MDFYYLFAVFDQAGKGRKPKAIIGGRMQCIVVSILQLKFSISIAVSSSIEIIISISSIISISIVMSSSISISTPMSSSISISIAKNG